MSRKALGTSLGPKHTTNCHVHDQVREVGSRHLPDAEDRTGSALIPKVFVSDGFWPNILKRIDDLLA